MRRVEGHFDAGKHGRLRFAMTGDRGNRFATIFLEKVEHHRVVYRGQLAVYRAADDNTWAIDNRNSTITRADGKPINYWPSSGYMKLRAAILASFADYSEQNAASLVLLARLVARENEYNGKIEAVYRAEQHLKQIGAELDEWRRDHMGNLIVMRETAWDIDRVTLGADIVEG